MRHLILLSLLLACCGRHHAHDTPPDQAVAEKAQLYLQLTQSDPSVHDSKGFVDTSVDLCDSLEFSCLAYAAGDTSVQYSSAESGTVPGLWGRDSGRTCGPANGSSSSTVSRDTLVGLSFCLWQANDTGAEKGILGYATAHAGIMGAGDPALTQIQPFLSYLFLAMLDRAGKVALPPHPAQDSLDDPAVPTGYVAHITMIGFLMDALVNGGMLPAELEVAKLEAERQPRNALYQAIYHRYSDGDQSVAWSVLLDETLFPADRLPTSAERSSQYLWQRDYPSSDWEPGSGDQEFSGTDFLFAAAVANGSLRGAQ